MIQSNNTLVADKLIKELEQIIRSIVREELKSIIEQYTDIFHLDDDMPIYNDLLEIKQRKQNEALEFMTHDEVWSD
ncbi:MAG: hypothetical protein HQK66_06510 [Desulfamplus sp.]|nr:hypothetical protein [Desulfamplus sp.]